MLNELILASSSETRRKMLESAGVSITTIHSRIDEDAIKSSLISEAASARDIADAVAEQKAKKIATKNPGSLVLGSDQILEFQGKILSKPTTKEDLIDQLQDMAGQDHSLFSAAVIYDDGEPVWRSVSHVRLSMRALTNEFIESYVERNWEDVRFCVGGYKIEAEGIRLFSRIEGDYFSILGLPLLDVLNYLTQRGLLEG